MNCLDCLIAITPFNKSWNAEFCSACAPHYCIDCGAHLGAEPMKYVDYGPKGSGTKPELRPYCIACYMHYLEETIL